MKRLIALLFLLVSSTAHATTYTSEYPPAYNSTYVKDTSNSGASEYAAHFAANPANALTGSWSTRAWISANPGTTNQRWHIDLGSAKIIRRIYYENVHNSGGNTTNGVKNFTFWGSNDSSAFSTLTYGTDTNWTQLTTSQSTLDEHSASNAADPKYITITNSTAYQYYAVKCADNWGGSFYMGIRRMVMQTEDGYTGEPAATTVQRGYII